MQLNDKQRIEVKGVIESAKQTEYKSFNNIIAKAVKELKKGVKTEEQAYNKIYKKVVKNEHHLAHRYAELDDAKSMRTLAEVFADDIINMYDFENLDQFVKKEVYRITGINA